MRNQINCSTNLHWPFVLINLYDLLEQNSELLLSLKNSKARLQVDTKFSFSARDDADK